jgi:ribosomal protein S18 acetylase RimI-like enzyme
VAARPPPPVGVTPLEDVSFTPAQEALGRAFGADPLFTYLVPEAARRARFLSWYAGAMLRLGRRVGVVDAAAVAPAPVAGVAVWLRPGHTALPLHALVRARLLPGLPLRLGPTGFGRFVRFARAAEGLHQRAVPGPRPHWYLLLLGVAPERQRQGFGSALVRAGLDRAAAGGLPCYLETLNAADLPFYHKHGFAVAATGAVPRGGPPLWAMVWAPGAPGGG